MAGLLPGSMAGLPSGHRAAAPKRKVCPCRPAHCSHHVVHLGTQNKVQGILTLPWGLENSEYVKGNKPGTGSEVECQPQS